MEQIAFVRAIIITYLIIDIIFLLYCIVFTKGSFDKHEVRNVRDFFVLANWGFSFIPGLAIMSLICKENISTATNVFFFIYFLGLSIIVIKIRKELDI